MKAAMNQLTTSVISASNLQMMSWATRSLQHWLSLFEYPLILRAAKLEIGITKRVATRRGKSSISPASKFTFSPWPSRPPSPYSTRYLTNFRSEPVLLLLPRSRMTETSHRLGKVVAQDSKPSLARRWPRHNRPGSRLATNWCHRVGSTIQI